MGDWNIVTLVTLSSGVSVTSLATPPRAPKAVRFLQPNAPQPITLLRPFILSTTGSICWWARGVKGQVGGSIPTGNNPPNMNGRRRVMGWGALGCSNLTASGARGGVARDVTVSRVIHHKSKYPLNLTILYVIQISRVWV